MKILGTKLIISFMYISALSSCSYKQVSSLEKIIIDELPDKYKTFIHESGGSHFVTVKGSRIHYLDLGDPNGEPYLFVHGTPVNAYVWRNILPALQASGRRLIAVDLIGYGLSDRPDINYSFSDESEYLTGFIQALNLRNINFIAHDIGGQASFGYAQKYPDNVQSIAAFETLFVPFKNTESFDFKMSAIFNIMRAPVLGGIMAVELNQMVPKLLELGVLTPLSKEDIEVYEAFFKQPESRRIVLNVPRNTPIHGKPVEQAIFVEGYSKFLKKGRIPLLVINIIPGAVPDIQAESAMLFANVAKESIRHSGHFVQEDRPGELVSILNNFWSNLKKQPGL